MVTITLRIDNLDTLPDGGPLRYTGTERGFSIGRNETLDWTLPDPSRFISGTHCEISFDEGGYWLSDVSTNGTFVNGSRQRVKSPYRLRDGDRISIGHYIIAAAIGDEKAVRDVFDAVSPTPAFSPAQPASDDIWGSPAPGPAPIDRRDLMPVQQRGRRAADFSQEFLDLPEMRPSPAMALRSNPEPARPEPNRPEPGRPNPFDAPLAEPAFAPANDGPFSAPVQTPAPAPRQAVEPFPALAEAAFAEPAPRPVSGPRQPAVSFGMRGGDEGQADVLRRFALGAGLDPKILAEADPGETAEEIGRMVRIVVEDVQQLLRARSAAKQLTKSSKRTMLGRINNPLKFLPTPEEVLEVLLTRRRPGYMPAAEAFREAMGDLKRHELATYAAMQTALSRLLADMSPEAIESKVSGSAFSSKKARSWEMYVARWEAKTEPHENGMLDVFLAYFADAYDEGSADRPG